MLRSLLPSIALALSFSLLPGLAAAAGNDSCVWANDGECDDATLGGTGACEPGTDATDCAGKMPGGQATGAVPQVPFPQLAGDDSCQWARDGECDEARFGGGGYCANGTDATDCAPIAATAQCQWAFDYECDEARFGGGGYCPDGTDTFDCALLAAGVADDSCQWAHDGECDEPRYGSVGYCRDGSDTTDCRAQAGGQSGMPTKPGSIGAN